MRDRRQQILQAGLDVLREEGLNAFTQPRIAMRAELRQSHLTYYFPTRLDLLIGVAELAMNAQLLSLNDAFSGTTRDSVAENIARTLMSPERTRVLMALAQSADSEPRVRSIFQSFSADIATRLSKLLSSLGADSGPDSIVFLHSTVVGMSILLLAHKPENGELLATAVMKKTIGALIDKPSAGKAL